MGKRQRVIRNIGIFAHVDAGKTTLTEQMLVHAGRLRQPGSVDSGTAYTDSLPVERRRGISVKATCVSLQWKQAQINLIDTPGHSDFSAEIERSFWALDAAVLVVDAVKGVQPQTEAICRMLKKQNMSFLVFLNKTDRPEADPARVLKRLHSRLKLECVPLWDEERFAETVSALDDDLTERFLEGDTLVREELERCLALATRQGRAVPVLKGSALRGVGIEPLLDAVIGLLPEPDKQTDALSGVVFAVSRDRLLGRGVWIRLFGGRLTNRMPLDIVTGLDRVSGEEIVVQRKITQIRDASGSDTGQLCAGEIALVYGLGEIRTGYVLGDRALLPRSVEPGQLKTPLITVQLTPEDPGQLEALREACAVLSDEDPLLQAQLERRTGEMRVQVMGRVQLEILQEMLETRFGLKVSAGKPSVIYRETIAKRATGFVAYTMPKPCWAILEFDIKPAPRGSGVRFSSTVPGRDIMPRYQHQVEQALPLALSQGRLGWQVTDVDITLVGGNHHLIHTHPLDFIVATPMGIQDGLQRGGSVLLEPIYEFVFIMQPECAGRVMSDVQLMRGEVVDTASDEELIALTALVPVSQSMDYPSTFASITSGKGSVSARLHSYRECAFEPGMDCPRRGVDPLDTAKYILAARSALEGNIFD